MELFTQDNVVGVFRGFREGGLEFHADLVLPYQTDFQSKPMHGQFLLVQLENIGEAVLGRITSLASEGKLSIGSGEEFNIRAVRENRDVPEDLREQYLRYRVNIRVLGVVRLNGTGKLSFVASHRRLPHVGSRVAFPTGEMLQELAGHNVEGANIGYFALGEYIYAGDREKCPGVEEWMQVLPPEVNVRFPIKNLVSRRSFIFARAGFGKSNLNKLLFSTLYSQTPTITKREGREVPVGTVIFDPDGEYFWPDDKGRPGLCDVPHLEDKLVVFTSQESQSPFYQSFVAGGIRLDIRRLRPSDVIAIALGPERQDQQNVRKLRGLDVKRWEALVDLIDVNGHQTPLNDVCDLLDLEMGKQDAEALAARSNMTTIVRMLHDRSSQLMDMLLLALSKGRLCVVDVSRLRGSQALVLSGLILRRIFDRNQQEFTKKNPQAIPTIAVVEEAQAVLHEQATSAEPYITWVKEGRKYDLGAVLVTQQPGSIPSEILSQGDNWFIFHLLSETDLQSVARANAHFSKDLLSTLLNEPIPGQGVFWSSVGGGKTYPVSLRVHSFEQLYRPRDPGYNQPSANTFACTVQAEFEENKQPPETSIGPEESTAPPLILEPEQEQENRGPDVKGNIEAKAIEALRADLLLAKVKSEGVAWGSLKAFFLSKLPPTMDDRDDAAYHLVPKALDLLLGPQGVSWHSYRDAQRGNKTYVKAGPLGR